MSDGATYSWNGKFRNDMYKHVIGKSVKGYTNSIILEVAKGIVRFRYEDQSGFPKIAIKDFAEIEVVTISDYNAN